ncbi:hypothetical protein MITS9509_03499 [Synechococcus sp. MIT S9509]|uniref:hypothetical protein n=1 Tax=Synechococcus sp. MIT S9509 TaxID=1801630 RepID=UPI0007BBD876|nr:hypothetical protein [Synechococcus sp. MIT S9509]KZR86260.1 hypothetical protein MITS9509_03499 [Synechococcus sp. MIT S9509]
MLGDDLREANRRRVLRDLAARDAARAWKRESQRMMLSTRDARKLAPELAKHGFALERRDVREQEKQRRQRIKDRADQLQSRSLRRRGLQG